MWPGKEQPLLWAIWLPLISGEFLNHWTPSPFPLFWVCKSFWKLLTRVFQTCPRKSGNTAYLLTGLSRLCPHCPQSAGSLAQLEGFLPALLHGQRISRHFFHSLPSGFYISSNWELNQIICLTHSCWPSDSPLRLINSRAQVGRTR